MVRTVEEEEEEDEEEEEKKSEMTGVIYHERQVLFCFCFYYIRF